MQGIQSLKEGQRGIVRHSSLSNREMQSGGMQGGVQRERWERCRTEGKRRNSVTGEG